MLTESLMAAAAEERKRKKSVSASIRHLVAADQARKLSRAPFGARMLDPAFLAALALLLALSVALAVVSAMLVAERRQQQQQQQCCTCEDDQAPFNETTFVAKLLNF